MKLLTQKTRPTTKARLALAAKNITISDVARELGLHVTTVQKVLSYGTRSRNVEDGVARMLGTTPEALFDYRAVEAEEARGKKRRAA